MSTAFPGTRRERRCFDRVMKQTTVSAAVHDEYRRECSRFVKAARHPAWAGAAASFVTRATLVPSALFEGREYLVVHCRDSDFTNVAAMYEAICVPEFVIDTYPAVLLPDRSAHDETAEFRSIIEHEFVHANQALLGRFARRDKQDSPTAAVRAAIAIAVMEYEANLLQLGRWPLLLPKDVSLTRWSMFRGWSDALSVLVRGELCSIEVLPSALTILGKAAAKFVRDLDGSAADAQWFSSDFTRLVAVVARSHMQMMPGAIPPRTAALWWLDQTERARPQPRGRRSGRPMPARRGDA